MFDPVAVNAVQFCTGMKDSFPINISIQNGFLELQREERDLKFSSTVELCFCFSILIFFYFFNLYVIL